MDGLPVELNVITLNCWGRKYTSPHRQERLTAIGRYLATTEPVPHIVALQECFQHEDYLSIRRETRFALPFGKFYHSGAFSCGLVILSRWPIEESSMVPFPLCGRPAGLLRGGVFVGTQGVACARIRYGEGEEDVVEVFNTNTHPSYENSSYDIHRLSQAWEIAKLARNAAERGHLAVVLADLNATPFSLPYRLLTSHAAIRDAWRVLYPDSSLGSSSNELERARGRPVPTASFNVAENGATSNSAYNTWAWTSSEQRALRSGKRPMLISPEVPDEDGQRVDYIFFSRGGDPHAAPTDLSEILSAHNTHTDDGTGGVPSPPGWVIKDVRVGLMARHPDLGCSLSDRFSVEATLILHTPTPLHHRRRRRSRSRSKSRANSPDPYGTLGDETPMSPKRSGTVTRSQTPRATPTSNTIHNIPPNIKAIKEKGNERGRPATPHSFTSTDAGINTLGARAAAMEKGTYLQSPTASSYRRGSRDRAAWDLQLSSLELGSLPRLPLAAYDEILHLISKHASRMDGRRRMAIAHFAFWAVILVGSYVGVWFLPGGKGAFGLLVASSLGFAAGVVTLLLALLFYTAELNKLNEFEWEIRNAKAVIGGMCPDTLTHQGSEEDKVW
ncbi:putative inositol phosphosphingolipids phospholipase C [Rosellinia necatrix]|uniref:Putative inositol phosphosphingolipids phospholipase C n=1 Tax=Rosellinia necatrix TaxID=77044 RepID=A0A1W2TD92_ROSNE|nr:putative inositol phosphosphingolipids phospholipase C [Rosellinia necatrix]